jgi:outer membrane receptor protein involved in Fe transport
MAVNGEIQVKTGDRIPGLPKHIVKLGANYFITPKFLFGGTLSYQSSQFFRGDEANLNEPVSGFTLLSLFSEYRVARNVTIFAKVDNVLNEKYENFGLFGEANEVLGPEFDDNRFLSPGSPIGAWGGLRLTF